MRPLLVCCLFVVPALGFAADPPAKLPRVLLLGDSIRLGYAPTVIELLKDKAVVVSPGANHSDTTNLLKQLDKLLTGEPFAVIHFNCGLHDLKLMKASGQHQVPIADYEKNLTAVVERCRKVPNCTVLFASTTPIQDALHGQRKADFDRKESDVERYNLAARAVMDKLQVPVTDLHAVVVNGGIEKLQNKDGTHYSAEGSKLLGNAVAEAIRGRLPVVK